MTEHTAQATGTPSDPPPTTSAPATSADPKAGDDPWTLTAPGLHVSLTHSPLSATQTLSRVRSPAAGANVLFSGTTRDTFDNRPVKELQYTAYHPLALRTMLSVAERVKTAHGLEGVAVAHRLGVVPVGEESVLIAVSAAHRAAAWRAGEQALEEIKEKVEVWKREEFYGGEGVWRANRDGAKGVRLDGGGGDEEACGKEAGDASATS